MRRFAGLLLLAGLLGCAFGGAAPRPAGTWVGSLRLPARADASPVSVELRGGSAVVSLQTGHAARTTVPARITAGRLRFSLASRTGPLVFDLRLKGRRLSGTVRHGSARGTVTLRRGRALEAGTLSLYRFADGRPLAVMQGFGPRVGILFGADEVRALYRTAPGAYAVGSGSATREPSVGTATFAADHAVWRGERAARVSLRQEQVRVPAGRHQLACTLTIPPGEGRRPAVTFAHGSGPAPRAWLSALVAFYADKGLVTLACDKRGIGQSGGEYPGENANATSIDAYARDVQALVRWLARQPEVDPARLGISGGSQAGWIMPLAASREPAVRWIVTLVGPTYTTDEDDIYSNLAGQGNSIPTTSDEAIEAEVRRARGGFDPLPPIEALRVPALWLYGGRDRHVSTRISLERLDPVAKQVGRDFSYAVFPRANHGLIETETQYSLQAEVARSSRFAEGLWATNRLVAALARALLVAVALLAAGCSGGDDPQTAAPAPKVEPSWMRLQPGGPTSCARGDIYSFWVRRADPAKLVIFFQGGGGCWNAETCAPNSEWFDDSVDEGDNPRYQRGIFDFDRADNPFRDWSFVFIPYCTGDIYTGTRDHDYGVFTVRHRGRTNAEAALVRTFARFRNPRQVLVTGCSAGSVGAAFHAARVLAAYPAADVAVLGDSLTLPFARPLDLSLAGGPRSFSAELLMRDLAEANPQATFARFNYANDAIQRRFDAPVQRSLTPFEQRLRAAETRLKRVPNYRSYLACGTEHCVLPEAAFYSLTVGGVRVRDWTANLAAGRDVGCPTCRGR